MSPETINTSPYTQKEHKRRRRELVIAIACFALIAVLTYVELKLLGVDSYLFLGLFNLNFILLLLVLFIVVRNGVKLLLERRRKVLGSRLRTRMVLAFMSLSLIPTLLMFLVSVKFVQTSVDYWFKGQVEDSMEQALELGRAFYASAQERLQMLGGNMVTEIRDQQYTWGGKAMDAYLDKKRAEYGLGLLLVISPEGRDQNPHMEPRWEQSWPEIRGRIDLEGIRKDPQYWSTILPTAGSDFVLGLIPVDGGRTGFLVLGQSIGQGLLFRLDQVVRGLDEYKKLKTLKSPWKMTLYMTLGVMTMLIILGAIWFGFRLAKELSAPVQALAAGTERVARGDLEVVLEDQSGDELGFLVQSFNRMTRDLAESRASLQSANERLAQQNRELEKRGQYIAAVLDNITSGVISMDTDGRIQTVNMAAQALLGVDSRLLVGRKPLDFLYGDMAAMLTEALAGVAEKPGSQWQRQMDLPIKGRTLKLLVNVVSLKAEPGTTRSAGAVAVFEDITELEKMQRLAAWREVARRIAHEIKNPLTPIKLSAQRLQRKYGKLVDEKTFEECTGLIVRQVERMQQMVTEFSAYAKLPEVVLTPDHPAPVLEETVAMFENTYRRIDWSLSFDGPIYEIPMDREALRKVFINLLTNAAEALEAEKDAAQAGDGPRARVDIRAWRDPETGWVSVTVADNGPGLSGEEAARAFEPYFSRKKGGTGLGLTIVKAIVNDHRGRVQVRPNAPRGSLFTVELPGA